MVQILERQPTKFEQLIGGISQGLGGLTEGTQALKGSMDERRSRSALADQFGDIFKNVRNPNLQSQLLQSELHKRELEQKAKQEELSLPDYETVKSMFGEDFANAYKIFPTGGKTELIKAALGAQLRGNNIRDLFGQDGTFDGISDLSKKPNTIKTPAGEDFALPEISQPKSQTPAENVKYKRELRNDNKPIFTENVNKSRALKDTSSHLNILESLSDKIPEYTRLLVDKEGNFYSSALKGKVVPKEAERFVKTVNDFLTSAKDMFGARVTNFDIAQFKSRLPGLMNSREGRKDIIKQMQIFNKIEGNYRNALNSIYKHYRLDGIPQEEAERLAEEMVGREEENLRSQLLAIGKSEESFGDQRMSLEEIFG